MTEQSAARSSRQAIAPPCGCRRTSAFAFGTEVTIERRGDTVTIRPVVDAEAALANNRALVEEIRAIWADAPYREVEKRQAPIAPYRRGLI